MRDGKDRLRKQAKSKLEFLYARQNSLCWWCASQTVILRHIPEEVIISTKPAGFVRWRHKEGLVLEGKIATVDHLKNLAEGGNSDISNLVLACYACNNRRCAQSQISPIPDEIRQLCPLCQGPKNRRHRTCAKCKAKSGIEWLKQFGWVEVPSRDTPHTKFVDPVEGESHILRVACRIQKRRNQEAGVI